MATLIPGIVMPELHEHASDYETNHVQTICLISFLLVGLFVANYSSN
jgi:hypothetical protein